MIRNVMNSESPMRIWLGGSCCVPSACRRSESTMMIRVKLVIMTKMAGANESTVSRMTSRMAAENVCRLLRSGTEICGNRGLPVVDEVGVTGGLCVPVLCDAVTADGDGVGAVGTV